VPTIVLDPTNDTLIPPFSREAHEQHFSNLIDYRTIEAGHNPPQETLANSPKHSSTSTPLPDGAQDCAAVTAKMFVRRPNAASRRCK
jgi:hypothetical protein